MIRGAVGLVLLVGSSVAVSPVQKVLEMMDEMKAKCVKAKGEEVVTFTKFQAFCQDTAATKIAAISDANDSNAKVLAEEIAKLDTSIATAEKNLADAQGVRD